MSALLKRYVAALVHPLLSSLRSDLPPPHAREDIVGAE
jgi:hypothetical protein